MHVIDDLGRGCGRRLAGLVASVLPVRGGGCRIERLPGSLQELDLCVELRLWIGSTVRLDDRVRHAEVRVRVAGNGGDDVEIVD